METDFTQEKEGLFMRDIRKVIDRVKGNIPDKWDLKFDDVRSLEELARESKTGDYIFDLVVNSWLLGYADGQRDGNNKLESIYHFVKGIR